MPETDAERRARERAEQGERARRAGDFAEADARRRLTDAGYDVFVLENSLGHGPDIIAVRDGRIRIIEVKANGGEFTPAQSLGGPGYIRDVFNRIDNGIGPRDWNTTDLDNFMEANGIRSRQDLYDAEYELWRYRDVDGDDASSVTRPSTAPWTPGSPAQQFEIDADGVKYNLNDDGSRRGPMRRPWQDIVEN